MFCTKCGSKLLDDLRFCRKFGKPLTVGTGNEGTAAVVPARAGARRRYAGTWLGLVLSIVAVGCSQQSGFTPITQPQRRTVKIGTGAITVNASSYVWFVLPVPEGATNVSVQGRFRATGGSGNDIEVYVLSDDEFTNWKNGHSTPTFYNSGKVTVGEVNATLPNSVGTYYLIFNNKFSLISPKAVQEDVNLTYYSY